MSGLWPVSFCLCFSFQPSWGGGQRLIDPLVLPALPCLQSQAVSKPPPSRVAAQSPCASLAYLLTLLKCHLLGCPISTLVFSAPEPLDKVCQGARTGGGDGHQRCGAGVLSGETNRQRECCLRAPGLFLKGCSLGFEVGGGQCHGLHFWFSSPAQEVWAAQTAELVTQ